MKHRRPRKKGDSHLLPERPEGCFAQKVAVTFFAARAGFTLFELILAIALSAALLTMIGTAINLYLMRVDASRTRVEEAQLARSLLAMIADDIRATTVYKPQDTSAIAGLIASGMTFDVDSNDNPRSGSSGASSNAGGAVGGSSTVGGSGSASSASGASSTSDTSAVGSPSSQSGSSAEADDSSMPLGLRGTLAELYVDVTRLPSREELFSTITGYTNAPLPAPAGSLAAGAGAAVPTGIVPPSDLKTVRYFVRHGGQTGPGSGAATPLAPDLELPGGGLVRQVIPRNMRVWAEQTGNSAVLESGQSLVAPEVEHLEFRYYDGIQVTDVWDMSEERSLPRAVEVRIWLASSDPAEQADVVMHDLASRLRNAREYRQTVYLPMWEVSGPSSGGSVGGSSSSSTTSSSSAGSSSFGESSSSQGSSLGQP